MILIVVSKVKELAKAGNLRTSAEFIEALNKKVADIVIQAAQNCKAEGGRATLKPKDLGE